jgi:DNA-binding MarR family transcriptional regulator
MDRTLLILDAFLPYRLSFTSNLVSEQIADAYQSLFGLSIPEWRVIAVIAEEGGVTQHAICRRTRMDKVTVSRASIRLQQRKLIARAPNRIDGRSHVLALTSSGWELYDSIAPKAIELETEAFSCLTEEERAQLHALLRKIEAGSKENPAA